MNGETTGQGESRTGPQLFSCRDPGRGIEGGDYAPGAAFVKAFSVEPDGSWLPK